MDFSAVRSLLENNGFDFSKPYVPYAADIREYIRRHDVVFRTPMKQGFEGFPVGNGDFAAMVWNTDNGLSMQINKNDLWVYPDEVNNLLLRAAGQLHIDFGMPAFNYLYLKDFEARLSIADGTARFTSETPFSRVDVCISAAANRNLLIIDLSGHIPEEACIRIALERYGSRSYERWDCRQDDTPAHGLGLARAETADGVIRVFEPFDGEGRISCAMAAACLEEAGQTMRINSRRAELALNAEGEFHKTILLSVASSLDGGDPTERATNLLREGKTSLSTLREEAHAWWGDFWNRSFVRMSREGQQADFDYLENLYCMQNYVMAVSSRGKFPAAFNGGLCVWNHDIRQWVNPHHWNAQQAYWSIEQSNRPELMKPYLDTYTRIIPQARAHAKRIYNSDNGLAIAEMHDYEGRMQNYLNTSTPAMQIGIHFWNHYLYNQDMDYLRDIAFPYLSRCANLYSDFAKYDEKTGVYHIGPVMPSESSLYNNLYDTTLDATMTRYILPVALKAAELLGIEDEQTAAWKHLYEHLFDYTFFRNYAEGEGDALIMGFLPDEDDPTKLGAIIGPNHFFCRSITPLMPAGIIGMKNKGTKLYESMRFAAQKGTEGNRAIHPTPGCWARLGEGEKALDFLFNSVDQLQHFPQGLFYNLDHWHQYSRSVKANDLLPEKHTFNMPFYQRDYLYDERVEYDITVYQPDGSTRKEKAPTQPFAQCGLETAAILTHAWQEIAMQSYEGVIRLFPAMPERCDGLFTQKAVGGFMVTAACREGKLLPIAIVRSLFGLKCVIDAPFDGLTVCSLDGTPVQYVIDPDGFVAFDTDANETYILWGEDLNESSAPCALLEMTVNSDQKSYKNAVIGRKRMF